MKVNVTEEPAWKRVLAIEVEPEIVDREKEAVIEAFRKKLNLPGFRKGKVPKDLARKYLGRDLEGEVLQRVIPKVLQEAFLEKDLRPIGDPAIGDLEFEEGRPLSFTATVEIAPQIEITGYKGLAVTREVAEVEDETVNTTLDALREQRATLEETDRPARIGDVVDVAYVELNEAGEPVTEAPSEGPLELGGKRTPESFSQGLEGMVAAEEKVIELPFPEDYPEEALAGTSKHFRVNVVRVKEKIWPALDDAFAQAVMGKEDATADLLREQIRLNHEADAFMQAQRVLADNIIKRLLELNPFELPEGMVNSTLDRILEDARKENEEIPEDEAGKLRDTYRVMVENRYRSDILMEAVAKQEGIEVTAADLDREIEQFAGREGRPAAKIKAELKKEGGLERLERDIFQRRVTEKLIELAEVTEIKKKPGAEEETK